MIFEIQNLKFKIFSPQLRIKNLKFKSNRGFTLIELLIVIFVISILISILLPNIKGMQQEGNIVAAKGDLKSLSAAINSYYTHNEQTYPGELNFLTQVTPKLISNLPTDRFAKGNYNYTAISDYYVVWTNGPNKKQDYQIKTNTQTGEIYIDKNTIKDDILETNLPIQ